MKIIISYICFRIVSSDACLMSTNKAQSTPPEHTHIYLTSSITKRLVYYCVLLFNHIYNSIQQCLMCFRIMILLLLWRSFTRFCARSQYIFNCGRRPINADIVVCFCLVSSERPTSAVFFSVICCADDNDDDYI